MSEMSTSVPTTLEQWREAYGLTPERDCPFTTLSGEPIRPLYTAADLPDERPPARGHAQK